MNETPMGTGKVVVNRSMSLDGFIAGPEHDMNWIFDLLSDDEFPEVMAATGAMLVGRGTHEVGKRLAAADVEMDYEGGAQFVLTHNPPTEPEPGITFVDGDLSEVVATALAAADGKNLEILGADVATQCLKAGLVDEILVYVLPILLGDGVRMFGDGLDRTKLEPIASKHSGGVTLLRFNVLR